MVIDKPSGWTSHDVVGKCRRIVGQKRIGHAGTLDPGATGVLLVGLGRATRLMQYVSELPKTYVGEVVLGTTTNTLDDEGEITGTFDMPHVAFDDVQRATKDFVGPIMQVPPMVSALKIDGKRLHELAREGIEVERKARPVTVFRYDVEPTAETHVFRISVDCSSGTYIRTLAADLGEALGGGAHLRRLRRTAIGPFNIENAVSIETLEEAWQPHVLSAADMVGHIERVVASPDAQEAIRFGRPLSIETAGVSGTGRRAMVDEHGLLLGLYEIEGERLIPLVVLAAK